MATVLDATARELRARLRDERFLATVRSSVPAGVTLRSAAALEETLEQTLLQHPVDADIHVFAYGSLMWNPALEHVGQATATVHGWHRSFCLRNLFGRGGPARPGLMLALDRGGSCKGVLLRIAAHCAREELAILWRREMTWGTYDARWVTAWVDGAPVPAVTFVANRGHVRYVKGLPASEAARLINSGEGNLGTCRAYFDATLAKLRELGIEDHRMEQLRRAVCAHPGCE
ncbi:gamma-glutamylcyclotransferase [Ramlibacter montanisoli]|uniref:glutathione-specific gamma-glutamylcyclotransferase n=1 Tax=Ramlibacter montanisoli TaxID=2732512 RepID=A0A849K6H7_9BURK|nr:gamma-glutamylcyclotransferase [Ramlibacter montanisoli]NNU42014.1 gamma-glutamylcyclotransferase [Ramlibacter montanisoli]